MSLRLGDLVSVGPAYRWGYPEKVADGFEGEWYVVGVLPGGDYKLAKHPEGNWRVIINESRLSVLIDELRI